jgi:Holliday junction resolvase RusA-like endonuclease
MGKFGAYYGKRYETWKRAAEQMCELLAYGRTPTDDEYHVAVHSVVLRPRTGKLPFPIGDVDNYAKAPLDAITKGQLLWHDDKQIVTLQATKRYAIGSEEPHTYAKLSTTMGGLWCDHVVAGWDPREDVFDLPEALRVPPDWYEEISTC